MSFVGIIRSAAAVALSCCAAGVAVAQTQPQMPFSYSVKFLCGPSVEGFQEGTVRGVYVTAVNLFNLHSERPVRFAKSVARALPFQNPGDRGGPLHDEVGPQQAIAIECDEIRMMLASPMSTEFRTGVLSILAEGRLEVTAVYSARPQGSDVSTIDIERIEAHRIDFPPRPEPDPEREPDPVPQADLTVLEIVGITTRCGSAFASCITTARVRIANIGAVAAGPFQTRALFDPNQSVPVLRDQPGGLDAGAVLAVPFATPQSPNCLDPDCTICVTVDWLDQVQESDETNNTLCATQGS
jgi:hypothetical protein